MSKKAIETVKSELVDIDLGRMMVNPRAQRKLRPARVDELTANLDLTHFGYPVLNQRGLNFYVIDGQHRIEALKNYLGKGWEDQKIPCRVYRGLTEQQEADMFDHLNNTLQVSAFDKFATRLTAGRQEESTIERIVKGQNLSISQQKVPGAISAVTTLKRVYARSNADTLSRTLRIIRESFGDAGFEAMVIDGIGQLCQRYNGTLNEKEAIDRLRNTNGGVKGLLGRADVLHRQTRNAKSQCVAAAAVDVINAKRGGKKLPSWWKTQQEAP